MRQRTVLVVAAWLAGAAATATVATAAVNASGAGLLGPSNQVLSQSEVRRRLATVDLSGSPAPSGSPIPIGSAGPAPTGGTPTTTASGGQGTAAPDGAVRPLSTPGGTVFARCSGDEVTLVSEIPAQGYRVDDVDPGPASSARVKFKAGRGELRVTVVCTGGQPRAETKADDH